MADAKSTKQEPCKCKAFGESLRDYFIENIGEEFFLASKEGGGGSFSSTIYGPKINNCPFCGTPLAKLVRGVT